MNPSDHAAVMATFLPGNCVELRAVDGMPPTDPEEGDAEYYRLRAKSKVMRLLKGADPTLRFYDAE